MSILKSKSDLSALCNEIEACKRFALDLEFVPERTYQPELCLVQIATENGAYIIDPYVLSDLSELWDKIADPEILVVVHAGDQDMDLVFKNSGKLPANITDTQIAAGFIGFGYPVGYGKLLQQLLGISISKAESYTDWTNRPLSPSQIEYALDDVKHLLQLHDTIAERLEKIGRSKWVEEECKRYTQESYYQKDRGQEFLRIKGASGLSRKNLAVLKSLSDWRHEQAARVNRPLRSIFPDNILIEFAKHPPKNINDIQRIRGIRPDQLKQYGESLLQAAIRGVNMPQTDWPQWPNGRIPSKQEVLKADFLFMILKIATCKLDLAPELVGTRGMLEALVRMHDEGNLKEDSFALLKDWRREIIGKQLLDILSGADCKLRLKDGYPPISLEVNGSNLQH
ncbi:MAG: HRDC domain-containing protein [Candidatus Obscuribacterales bacterium]|jgi:ribonuclease D|nr:HRDC domain-containing protein [Candidatus Obscuribacterales bacterium]